MLNRKGYMLVEIIVSFVLAMTIFYYLVNLTYNFKNKENDIYNAYYYTNDKILLTKNIINDIENNLLIDIVSSANRVDLTFKDKAKLNISKKVILLEELDNSIKIKYGLINEKGNFNESDISYYEKELKNTYSAKGIIVKDGEYGVSIIIDIKDVLKNTDYSIKLYLEKEYV